MKTKTVKSIFFRVYLRGEGIVNFDTSEQRFIYNKYAENQFHSKHDNVKYAKKEWYYIDDNKEKADYNIIISSECLKRELYREGIPYDSPNIMHNISTLLNGIASPEFILRGYLFAMKDQTTFRRKSCVSLPAARLCNNAKSTLQLHSTSAPKTSDENKSGNQLYYEEFLGETRYMLRGTFDLEEGIFISADELFDRLGINPEFFDEFMKILKTKMNYVNGELGYYLKAGSNINIPEYGILFDKKTAIELCKIFFKSLLGLSIMRSSGGVEVEKIEYKLVYDSIVDKLYSDDGWLPLTVETVDKFDFEIKDFYIKTDYDKAKKERDDLDLILKQIKDKNKRDKLKKDTEKANQKKKREENKKNNKNE